MLYLTPSSTVFTLRMESSEQAKCASLVHQFEGRHLDFKTPKTIIESLSGKRTIHRDHDVAIKDVVIEDMEKSFVSSLETPTTPFTPIQESVSFHTTPVPWPSFPSATTRRTTFTIDSDELDASIAVSSMRRNGRVAMIFLFKVEGGTILEIFGSIRSPTLRGSADFIADIVSVIRKFIGKTSTSPINLATFPMYISDTFEVTTLGQQIDGSLDFRAPLIELWEDERRKFSSVIESRDILVPEQLSVLTPRAIRAVQNVAFDEDRGTNFPIHWTEQVSLDQQVSDGVLASLVLSSAIREVLNFQKE
jgi:hypothetical protein